MTRAASSMKWRYFGRTAGSGRVFAIYRWPDNGRPLTSQRSEDVQYIDEQQSWLSDGQHALVCDQLTGWFGEEEDELTEEEAQTIMTSWRESAHDVLVELLTALGSPDSSAREQAADETTSLHRRLSDADVSALVRGLVSALLAETTRSCQKAQLSALVDLKAEHAVDPKLLQPLEVIRAGLPRRSRRSLDDLLLK